MTRTKKIGPLSIAYDDQVLEPRPWTVAQAGWAAELTDQIPSGPLVELCSGVGHIGLLAAALTGRRAVLVDASAAACGFAAANAAAAGLGSRVEVRHGDLSESLGPAERFPLVLADPPYIPTGDVAKFPEDPFSAIDGGPDGLAVARLCLDVAARHLQPAGLVIVQLRDAEQAIALTEDPAPERGTLGVREVRDVTGHGALVLLELGPLGP